MLSQPASQRSDPTAHVPPMPYNGVLRPPPSLQQQPVYDSTPALSRRTKLLLGGAGLTIVAAIATIAIIKGTSSGKSDPPNASTTKGSAKGSAVTPKSGGNSTPSVATSKAGPGSAPATRVAAAQPTPQSTTPKAGSGSAAAPPPPIVKP